MCAFRKICRSLVVLLVASMLLPTFASCADHNEPAQETQDSSHIGGETEAVTELRDELPDDLNYTGEEIVFISAEVMSYDI